MASKKIQATCSADQKLNEGSIRLQPQMEQLVEASLCSNCRHLGDCTFLSKTSRAIQNCELYECGRSEKPRLVVVKKANSPVGGPESGDAFLGLCTTCDNFKSCRLPKPAGGVWMCEEYS